MKCVDHLAVREGGCDVDDDGGPGAGQIGSEPVPWRVGAVAREGPVRAGSEATGAQSLAKAVPATAATWAGS